MKLEIAYLKSVPALASLPLFDFQTKQVNTHECKGYICLHRSQILCTLPYAPQPYLAFSNVPKSIEIVLDKFH